MQFQQRHPRLVRASVPGVVLALGVILVAYQAVVTTPSPVVYATTGLGVAWLVVGALGTVYALTDRDAFVPALLASFLAFPAVVLSFHFAELLTLDASPSTIDVVLVTGFPVVSLGFPLGLATNRRQQSYAVGAVVLAAIPLIAAIASEIVNADGIGWALAGVAFGVVSLATFTIPAFPSYRVGVVLRRTESAPSSVPRWSAVAVSTVLVALLAILLPLSFLGVLGLGNQVVGVLTIVFAVAVGTVGSLILRGPSTASS